MNTNRSSVDLRWQLVALLALIIATFFFLSPVLTPFAIAAMFAYLFDPLANRLERTGLGRNLAVTIVFLALSIVVILVLLLLVPYLSGQVGAFLGHLPEWVTWAQHTAVPVINEKFNLSIEIPDAQSVIGMLQVHWKEAGGFATAIVAGLSKSGLAIVGWITKFVIVPVAFFYLLRDWNVMLALIHNLLPRSIEPTAVRLAREADSTLSGFVRGQLSVMLALGILYAAGLWAVGIDIGPLIGVVAGLISFVPYLGSVTGILMGVIAALVQYGDWTHVLLVLTVFAIGQLLEGYVLVPRLVGEKIGLHPLAVIFAVLAGGELFGFLGVLLALPVASVLVVVLRYLYVRYQESALYQAEASEMNPNSEQHPNLIVTESLTSALAPHEASVDLPHGDT